MIYYGMTYQFKSHWNRAGASLKHAPLLLAAQLPDGFLSLLQKLFETKLNEFPKLSFVFLYPGFCFSAALCSATTYSIIQSDSSKTFKYHWNRIYSAFPKLFLSSFLLGLVLAPATMALIIPGIYVLSLYLFVPFVVLDNPNQTLSKIFGSSKTFSRLCKKLCFLTASLSFFLGLVSYLGPSLLSQFMEASSLGPFFEVSFGMFVSLLLNIWTASLFLEINQT